MLPGFLMSWWLFLTPFVAQAPTPEKPLNVILVIGDGMGLAHIALAEYLYKPPSPLTQMQVVGLQKTHSATHLETDSGAAGTAMSCGVKTFNAAIGVDADSTSVKSILELARDHGMKTGLVVTSSIVHATPAAFYAHVTSRGSYEEIAVQLVASGVDVFVGGGQKYFTDRYSDGFDLIESLKKKQYEILHLEDPRGLVNLEGVRKENKIGCFTALEDPIRATMGRTYLPKMALQAATALEKRADKGYFLMVEASQVDWAAHANDQEWLALEMQDAYAMMEGLLEKVRKDQNTLLIITADHECGYMSLNGKRAPRVVFNSKVHSSQMVPVFADGPGAEEFLGIYENTEIFQKIKNLLNL
jgi:alkaline phosphatase